MLRYLLCSLFATTLASSVACTASTTPDDEASSSQDLSDDGSITTDCGAEGQRCCAHPRGHKAGSKAQRFCRGKDPHDLTIVCDTIDSVCKKWGTFTPPPPPHVDPCPNNTSLGPNCGLNNGF